MEDIVILQDTRSFDAKRAIYPLFRDFKQINKPIVSNTKTETLFLLDISRLKYETVTWRSFNVATVRHENGFLALIGSRASLRQPVFHLRTKN